MAKTDYDKVQDAQIEPLTDAITVSPGPGKGKHQYLQLHVETPKTTLHLGYNINKENKKYAFPGTTLTTEKHLVTRTDEMTTLQAKQSIVLLSDKEIRHYAQDMVELFADAVAATGAENVFISAGIRPKERLCVEKLDAYGDDPAVPDSPDYREPDKELQARNTTWNNIATFVNTARKVAMFSFPQGFEACLFKLPDTLSGFYKDYTKIKGDDPLEPNLRMYSSRDMSLESAQRFSTYANGDISLLSSRRTSIAAMTGIGVASTYTNVFGVLKVGIESFGYVDVASFGNASISSRRETVEVKAKNIVIGNGKHLAQRGTDTVEVKASSEVSLGAGEISGKGKLDPKALLTMKSSGHAELMGEKSVNIVVGKFNVKVTGAQVVIRGGGSNITLDEYGITIGSRKNGIFIDPAKGAMRFKGDKCDLL